MATSVGEFRESLVEAIGAVRNRKISAEEGSAIAKLAQQVSLSLQVEANIRREEKLLGKNGEIQQIGQLQLGESTHENGDTTPGTALKRVRQP